MDAGPLRTTLDRPKALDAACFGLARAAPSASSFYRVDMLQLAAGLAMLATMAATLVLWTGPALAVLHAAALVLFAMIALLRLTAAAVSAMGRPAQRGGWTGPLPTYTLLCPMYREPEVAGQLAAAIARLDYPAERLDVKFILESDDHATIQAVRALGLPPHFSVVLTPPIGPRTKPKALNYALAQARGQFVTIYDAEDVPDPRQLRAALDAFAAGGPKLGVVQAPLRIDCARGPWIAQQFQAEYAILFGEILPLFARLGLPFPLGGTSNHFRRDALTDCGGWDPYNVAEDADIGYRMAARGWRMDVIAPPTWEEPPGTFDAWLAQRTRWIKGHLQTWLVLMRRPARTIRGMGWRGFLAMQLMLGGSLFASFLHGPFFLLLAICALAPNLGVGREDWAVAGLGLISGVTGVAAAAVLTRDRGVLRAALTMAFYWPLASIAAVRAAVELVARPHHWAKTAHGLLPRRTLPP